MLLRPSGSTKNLDGTTPDNVVGRFGGHDAVNEELSSLSGVDPSNTYGFTLLKSSDGTFNINYNSYSVNATNHDGVRDAARSQSNGIIKALESTFGIKINQ